MSLTLDYRKVSGGCAQLAGLEAETFLQILEQLRHFSVNGPRLSERHKNEDVTTLTAVSGIIRRKK